MSEFKIYLSGGMSMLSFEKQTLWRRRVVNAIWCEEYEHGCKRASFFDPTMYYSLEEQEHRSEREVFEFDLNAVRKSDLIIVNFNQPNSIGTAMELMLAKELRIPVIGLNEDGVEIHPWLECCCTRICDNMNELINHIVEFYLK